MRIEMNDGSSIDGSNPSAFFVDEDKKTKIKHYTIYKTRSFIITRIQEQSQMKNI
jgi:hypothetical protein